MLGLTFCKRDLFQKISTEVMLDNIIVDPHFNYATSINTNLKIKTIDSNGKSMNNISIDIPLWDKIIKTGIVFATDVCLSYDNYISDKLCNVYN